MQLKHKCVLNDLTSQMLSFFCIYQSLRCLIPTEPVDRKLSKIETLRLATSYIEHLVASLEAGMHNAN